MKTHRYYYLNEYDLPTSKTQPDGAVTGSELLYNVGITYALDFDGIYRLDCIKHLLLAILSLLQACVSTVGTDLSRLQMLRFVIRH